MAMPTLQATAGCASVVHEQCRVHRDSLVCVCIVSCFSVHGFCFVGLGLRWPIAAALGSSFDSTSSDVRRGALSPSVLLQRCAEQQHAH